MLYKAHIKVSIVSHHRKIPAEIKEFRQPVLIIALSPHILVGYGSEFRYVGGYGDLRIYKMRKAILYDAILDLYSTNLDDATVLHGKAGGLYVKDHKASGKALSSGIRHRLLYVITEEGLTAVYKLQL